MKKLLIILILALATLAQTNDSRPYLHWKIHYVKVTPTETSPVYFTMVETPELTDAIRQFEQTCENCEIRAVARDYYFLCQPR